MGQCSMSNLVWMQPESCTMLAIDIWNLFPPVHMPVQEMAAACKALGIAGQRLPLEGIEVS